MREKHTKKDKISSCFIGNSGVDLLVPPNIKYLPQGLQTDDKGRQHLMRGADVKAK